MSDEELKNIIKKNYNDYTVEALEIIKEILEEREIATNKEIIELERNVKFKKANDFEENTSKYHALDFLAGIMKTTAWILIVLLVLSSLIIINEIGFSYSIILLLLVISGVIILRFYVLAELIDVFVEIENNTRLTKDYIKQIFIEKDK